MIGLTQYDQWVPYTGIESLLLAVVLFVIAILFAYFGMKLKEEIKVHKTGKLIAGFLIAMWCLAIAIFLVAAIVYGLQLIQQNPNHPNPTYPVRLFSEVFGVVTFVLIFYVTKNLGIKTALASAFIGTVAGLMIFELPFDLIVMTRTYPPISPSALLIQFLL